MQGKLIAVAYIRTHIKDAKCGLTMTQNEDVQLGCTLRTHNEDIQ